MAELKLVNVKKVYPWDSITEKNKTLATSDNPKYTEEGIVAVSDFNLEINDKEFIVLVGPSGCGKSTVLRMIAGLEEISDGEVYIGDTLVNNVSPKDRDIAMVFQNYSLYPHMTVYQNMAFALKMRHTPKDIIDQKVREAAEILGISELLDRKPKTLSGGQRQRVAIGRAIVREPKVFLMDEPLSNLDAKLRNQMRAEIIKLRRKIDTTFIYVTHDQTEAMTLGDRIVIMKNGVIQQSGTPQEVFDHPSNLFVAGFIGTPQMNFFPARLVKKDKYFVEFCGRNILIPELSQIALEKKNTPEQDITIGIRPEHFSLAEEGIEATLDVSEMMGSNLHLHVNLNGIDTIVIVNEGEERQLFYPGEKVFLNFSGKLMHLFDSEGNNLI